jgi:hypothetical protein
VITTLLVFGLLSTALFYLGSRALITRWLWSRYPLPLARWADCPSCSGFWYGVFLSLVIGDLFSPLLELGVQAPVAAQVGLEAFLVGLTMLVLTPLGAGLMQHALNVVGSAVDTDSNEG